MKHLIYFLTVGFMVFIMSCNNKSEILEIEKANDYYPMSVGKYITYKLDSTVYLGYTSTGTVISYYVKDLVEAQITDNLNRKSYRIIRYIKKNLTDPVWNSSSTYFVTPLENSIEYVENNLRYVRLANPVKNDNSWKGNIYIEANGSNSLLQYLKDWDYQYANLKQAKAYNNTNFAETVTVNQANDSTITGSSGYSDKNYSVEVFAKGTGLVFKDFLHWSYQPPQGQIPGYRTGYGIKLTIVDKN
jgi:hypothetical protein